jgi:hypothetical protein
MKYTIYIYYNLDGYEYMFYYSNKRLLSEGMSYDQILTGKNPDLYNMLLSFQDFLLTKRLINTDPESADLRSAQTKYILVNVIENGHKYSREHVENIDVENPTLGIVGKYTEFILRISNSKAFKKENWDLVSEFLNICKQSSSKVYKSKNDFFDNVIIPHLDKRVASGEKLGSINPKTGERGSNFSRPSPVSPLQDKVMKVFEAFGLYNGKNLLEVVMEEVAPENRVENISTFAGYDLRLIDYCLQKGHWKEFNVPSQPGGVRLFFIGNGNLENIKSIDNEDLTNDENFEIAHTKWHNMDYEDQEKFGFSFEKYLEYFLDELSVMYNPKRTMKSFSYYHVGRSLIYACNIYPFKTSYNISKGNAKISSDDIAFYKSLSDDDYIVTHHDYEAKIRKTTEWCTKDEIQIAKYIAPGSEDIVEGFILCLNNNLPFDDPNGALQIGIRNETDLYGHMTLNYSNRGLTLNADDINVTCPKYINDCFKMNSGNILKNLIKQGNNQYAKIRSLKFPLDSELNNEEKKVYFEKMLQGQKMTNENLLRRYVRQLLK